MDITNKPPYRSYIYHQSPSGYTLPSDHPMPDKRRNFWIRWQDKGLPIPHPISGRTGILHRAILKARYEQS